MPKAAPQAPSASGDRRVTLKELLGPLTSDGLLDKAQAKELIGLAASVQLDRVHPLVWLARRHLPLPGGEGELTLDRLTRWFAAHADLPYLAIDPLKIDAEAVTSVISPNYAARLQILPVEVDDDTVTFATAEPYERAWERELGHVLQREVKRVIANPLDIARYQEELFGVSQSIRRATRINEGEAIAGINDVEALVELGRAGKLEPNDRHIVTVVDWLLQYAFEQRASDIHLEPRRENGNLRFRIDGVLHTVYQLPAPILNAVTARIKALGRMDVVERRRPQDGRVKTKTPTGQEVELRLSTMPTAFGEKLVMRIFDPQVLVRDLSELGFAKSDARHWAEMTAHAHGIILVTGPTGSGKTTTLYSTLKSLARPDINLCTVEDPIEMVEPSFNQMQVNAGIGVTFAAGIRTLMRQDPDIIMVGEIRDLETAEMAIQAALTGHLVFSTLHTNDAASAVTRLMDLGVPSYLINATLIGVVAQRLVRTLCPHCKQPTEVPADAWAAVTRPWSLELPTRAQRAVGCDKCRGTGYLGRIGLYEILRMTSGIKERIGPDCSLDTLRMQALKDGLEPLRISGARKVMAGLTTVDEVLKVSPAFDDL